MLAKSLIPLALFTVAANTANAQAHFGLAAGATTPNGIFSDIVKSGYHLTALVPVEIAASPVGLRFDGTFSEMKSKLGGDAKSRLMYLTANAVLSARGHIAPYAIGGVGLYRATAECSSCSTKTTKGGMNGGAGVKFAVSGHTGFIEARFHYIAGPSDPTNFGIANKPTQFIPISLGWVF